MQFVNNNLKNYCIENLYCVVAGLHLYSFWGLFNKGKAIKRDIRVHCISSFGNWASICVTTEPEISRILGRKTEKQQFHIFEPLKAHTYEPNISLIKLTVIMQNPDYNANNVHQRYKIDLCCIQLNLLGIAAFT